jgi:hypothetical protein
VDRNKCLRISHFARKRHQDGPARSVHPVKRMQLQDFATFVCSTAKKSCSNFSNFRDLFRSLTRLEVSFEQVQNSHQAPAKLTSQHIGRATLRSNTTPTTQNEFCTLSGLLSKQSHLFISTTDIQQYGTVKQLKARSSWTP